jgi:hypothetical protein
VLGERGVARDGRRVVVGPDLYGWRLGWLVGVALQACVQAAGGFVPALGAGLVPAVQRQWQRPAPLYGGDNLVFV